MMSGSLSSMPADDGFRMPAEWERHRQTWMIWPERTDNWRDGAKPAQRAFLQVIQAIARFEPVSLCVSASQYFHVAELIHNLSPDHPVRVIEMSTNDAWCRDTGPTFLVNDQRQVRGVDWTFNAWGGLNGGLYFPWDRDDQVAQKILQIEGLPRYRTQRFVLEGGAIHVDGQGTLLTTQACLMNPNRNPHLSRQQIEEKLAAYLGISKVLWIPGGIVEDETDEHVDNMACFVRPGEVLMAWTEDSDDPQYTNCQAAYEYLCSVTDAQGRSLVVHKLPLPQPIYTTQEHCETVDQSQFGFPRTPGSRLAASYINFYLCNGGLILPQFNDPQDSVVAEQLQRLFPDRMVVPVPGLEILLGGGNVHCITQQQPGF